MARPLVSIAIPTWNRCELLRTTLRAAQAQTYQPLEIVVSDNASDDGTVAMVRELARDDDRIKLFVNDTNIGGLNYLAAQSRCRGEYVKFLNSDDLIPPQLVEHLAAGLDDPSVGLSIARQDWMDEQGRPFARKLAPPLVSWWRSATDLGKTRTVEGYHLGNYCLRATINAFGLPSSHMFRRRDIDLETIGMVGGRRYQILGDVAYSLQLAAGRRVHYSADSTVWIRIHDGAMSSQGFTNATGALDWLDLILAAPDLGYLAEGPERALAIRKAALDLAALPEVTGGDDLTYRVADGITRASHELQRMCSNTVPLDVQQDRLIARPDWTSTPPLRELIRSWALEAHTLAENELVLLVDPNMFALDAAISRVESILGELGLSTDSVPDITIETTAPAFA
jgi:hypothetical protein